MLQHIQSPKKARLVEQFKKLHFLHQPQYLITDPGEPQKNNQEESVSQQMTSNKNFAQQVESHYFPQPQKLFKELRSNSNYSSNNLRNQVDINSSFVFKIQSKNHLQNESIILKNNRSREKERQVKDLVKVLHQMRKKRYEYTIKGQTPRQSQSPAPQLQIHQTKQKNQEYLSSPTEKSPGKILKLPQVKKKKTIVTVITENDQFTKKSKLEGSSIGEDPFQIRLREIMKFIFSFQCQHLFYVKQSSAKSQVYHIEESGNNGELIRQLMSKRWWWNEQTERSGDVQFYWSQRSNSLFMQKQKVRVLFDNSQSRIVNVFDSANHEEQVKFAVDHKLTLIPSSGRIHNHIEINQIIGFKKHFLKFLNAYFVLSNEDIQQGFPYSVNIQNLQDPKYNIFSIKFRLVNTMWIVKPGEWVNNGQVMKICQNTKQVQDFITQELLNPERKYETFVIQQYIKPLLYYKRKFDIYCYLLISQLNGVVRVYFYDQGFGRTSSKEYTESDLDPLIHFTNTQVQQNSKSFSLYEPGNKLSLMKLQEFFIQFKINFKETMIPQFKKLATQAFKSVFPHFLVKDHNFEIIGLNYLIDNQFKPWLVELSLNPSFDFDCQMQQNLITRMLDNALYITLDLLYPPPILWPNNKKQLIEQFELENKFDKIFDSRFDSEKLLELLENNLN